MTTSADIVEMLHKRFSPPAWYVVEEVGNGTGGNVRRHADAVAINIWPSHGYEIHGIETKVSRSDVLKELADPSKADAVGKYCDYWWLVVSDLKILEGIEVPATWGVLYPRNRLLRVQRKAPKRAATPISRAFSAAIVRRVCSGWVSRVEHNALRANATETAKQELLREREWKTTDAEQELSKFRALVTQFEKVSGVKLAETWGDNTMNPLSSWQVERIGEAVKTVVEAREARGARFHGDTDEPVELVKRELQGVERAIESHEDAIANRRAAAMKLRAMIADLESDSAQPKAG